MERSINLVDNPYPAMTAECAEPVVINVPNKPGIITISGQLFLPKVLGKEPAIKPATKINIGSGEDVFC